MAALIGAGGSAPALAGPRSHKRAKTEFVWRGLALHLGRSTRPMLELVVDETLSALIPVSDTQTARPARPGT